MPTSDEAMTVLADARHDIRRLLAIADLRLRARVRELEGALRPLVSAWDAVHGPWNDKHATDEEIEAAESLFYAACEAAAAALATLTKEDRDD
jgi:hypothetical protein